MAKMPIRSRRHKTTAICLHKQNGHGDGASRVWSRCTGELEGESGPSDVLGPAKPPPSVHGGPARDVTVLPYFSSDESETSTTSGQHACTRASLCVD
jgi:hypothetical protein